MHDFNPRTPCGVRPSKEVAAKKWNMDFNPRTPCGVRRAYCFILVSFKFISIHAPHAGCDKAPPPPNRSRPRFQSTHPMRGATRDSGQAWPGLRDFNPRTPCGVRLEEKVNEYIKHVFQSTHPMRGATVQAGGALFVRAISIHAPHAGCDIVTSMRGAFLSVFQSTHPMRGATFQRVARLVRELLFQSTHPMRGAT